MTSDPWYYENYPDLKDIKIAELKDEIIDLKQRIIALEEELEDTQRAAAYYEELYYNESGW